MNCRKVSEENKFLLNMKKISLERPSILHECIFLLMLMSGSETTLGNEKNEPILHFVQMNSRVNLLAAKRVDKIRKI